MVGGNGNDAGVGVRQPPAIAAFAAARLDLGNGGGLIAFDQDQVTGGKGSQHLLEARLRCLPQFVDQGPAAGRDDGNLHGAGAPVPGAVGLTRIDLEGVMGVFHRRHPQAPARELLDQAHHQRGLAGFLPASDADHGGVSSAHHAPPAAAISARKASSSAGVLALKNGSISTPARRAGAKSTATVPWRPVQSRTLRTPPASAASRSAASATGHRPITGCSSPLERASAILPLPPATAASKRVTRSSGISGASPGVVTIQRYCGACASDQRIPASTPASGPTKPVTVSATTGSPKAAKRAGSPLALRTMALTCGASRSMTWPSMALPASGNRPLSPPPIRRDCPPASSTPLTGWGVITRSSIDGLGGAGLARMPAIFLADLGQIGVKDDAIQAGQCHEALAARPANQGEPGAGRQFHAPGGKAGAREQDWYAHFHGLDHHFRRQTAGGVENLVVGGDAVAKHVAGDLVDGVVPADVLHVDQRPVLRAQHAAMNGPRLQIEAGFGVDLLRQVVEPRRLDAGLRAQLDLVEILHQVAEHGALRTA